MEPLNLASFTENYLQDTQTIKIIQTLAKLSCLKKYTNIAM